MPGPGDLWAWLQSLGPGAGNVGPVNGFLPDPTQTPPNVGPGPGGARPSGGVYAPTESWRVPPANEGAQVVAPPPAGPVPWRVPPANEGPRRLAPAPTDPYGLTRANAPIDPYGLTPPPPPPPFNWLTSTGAGMSAPPGSPSAAPIDPYGLTRANAPITPTPTGPLATPAGQGGIGSDARFPLKRRAGAPNLGYYQPTTGNARGATWTPYTNPNDPRIFRG
jgi:hypothetical protein